MTYNEARVQRRVELIQARKEVERHQRAINAVLALCEKSWNLVGASAGLLHAHEIEDTIRAVLDEDD